MKYIVDSIHNDDNSVNVSWVLESDYENDESFDRVFEGGRFYHDVFETKEKAEAHRKHILGSKHES